jgi:hypothetical protein
MDAKTIESMLKHRPFMPFRIHMTGRSEYDITRPEMASVKPGVLVIDLGPPRGKKQGGVVYCSLDHIVSLETMRPV